MPEPTIEQLHQIALDSAEVYRKALIAAGMGETAAGALFADAIYDMRHTITEWMSTP